eukprot:TRINITY_DN28596_c0_g1_i1.p1 TRINITY_DN28596_c0_g1~~TRINITY_DN28596_c0_g1_i1.p1  ORF type:complete len:327 (-),score=53.00 TRINITY_DN28596_c0_g1_i1:208-1188(-)
MCDTCLGVVGLGCICCCHFKCNVGKLRTTLAFSPPDPPSYAVETNAEGQSRLVYKHHQLARSPQYQRAAESASVYWVKLRRAWSAPLVWLRPQLQQQRRGKSADASAANAPTVLLHCHGNATDVGELMPMYQELANRLDVEVVGVEYTGYGAGEGELHTSNIYGDIDAAYDFLIDRGVTPDRIVVYGNSVGSVPAVHLAASRPHLRGLVLHSPLASALRVLDRTSTDVCPLSRAICCFDIFRNYARMRLIQCPVFIMHGQCDEVVPFHNAQLLEKRCREELRWPSYFPMAGHNDIVEADPAMYFQRLSDFFCHLSAPRQYGRQCRE